MRPVRRSVSRYSSTDFGGLFKRKRTEASRNAVKPPTAQYPISSSCASEASWSSTFRRSASTPSLYLSTSSNLTRRCVPTIRKGIFFSARSRIRKGRETFRKSAVLSGEFGVLRHDSNRPARSHVLQNFTQEFNCSCRQFDGFFFRTANPHCQGTVQTCQGRQPLPGRARQLHFVSRGLNGCQCSHCLLPFFTNMVPAAINAISESTASVEKQRATQEGDLDAVLQSWPYVRAAVAASRFSGSSGMNWKPGSRFWRRSIPAISRHIGTSPRWQWGSSWRIALCSRPSR